MAEWVPAWGEGLSFWLAVLSMAASFGGNPAYRVGSAVRADSSEVLKLRAKGQGRVEVGHLTFRVSVSFYLPPPLGRYVPSL